MRKHLFYWLWLFLPVLSFSQDIPEIDWSEVYGGSAQDSFADIQAIDDGGYIMIGSTNSFELIDNPNNENDFDVWVIKTDSNGEVEWERTYGGTNTEGAIAIRKVSDGYVFAANTHSDDGDVPGNYGDVNNHNTARDIWIVKIDFNGDIIWSKNFGGPLFDTVFSLETTPDEGFVIGGVTPFSYFPEYSFSGLAGYILKLDSSGNIEWQKPYGGSAKSEISYVKPLPDGGYVFLGISKAADGDLPANNGSDDIWVGKIDNDGNLVWSKNFGGSSIDYVPYGSGIELTNDGGFLISATTTSYDGDVTESLDLFPGMGDIWVIKLNNLGELVWEKSFGGEAPDSAYEIRKTVHDNEYIIVGYTFPTFDDLINNNSNLLLTKIDNQGNTIWSSNFGGSFMDAYSLTGISVITNSRLLLNSNTNQYTITCTTASNDGDVPNTNLGFENFWLLKLAPDCIIPTIENSTTETICAGETAHLSVTTEGQTINWYDAVDAETPVFTGNDFTTPELTETTSYWVEVANWGCISERTEVIVTVNPLPELQAETAYEICSGNDAQLYAFSEGNVIFWYENEEDEEYLYHGNNFIIEGLEEGTHTYWVEAFNMTTGCTSERTEVTVTVNPTPSAPIVVEIYIAEEGQTLADLEEDIEFEGILKWYADEFLTIELPNTTPVQDNSVYFVTQTVNDCESEAAVVETEFLGIGGLHGDAFAYYPNPVKDKLYFTGKEKVQSVQIFDTSGKLIINKESTANGIEQLDVTSLPKGTYVVKAQTDKGLKTFKIVKN